MKLPYWDSVARYFGDFRGGDRNTNAAKSSNLPKSPNDSTTSSGNSSGKQRNSNAPPYIDRYRYDLQTYGPILAAEKFHKAQPFLILSLIMWPSYWVYRGYDWHNHRRYQTLQVYINRTFAQAKIIQICILSCAIMAASVKPPHRMLTAAAYTEWELQ